MTSIPASAASGADSAAQIRRLETRPSYSLRDRDRARHRANTPVERELADAGMLEEAMRGQLVRAGENGEGDRKVEPRPLLAERRRSEVDRDPIAGGPGQHRVDDPALHAVLRLLTGAIGEPDDRERRQVGRDEVRLDVDATRLEPDDGRGDSPCDHASDAYGRLRDVSAPEVRREWVYSSPLSARRRRESTRSTRPRDDRCAG